MAGNINRTPSQAFFSLDFLCFSLPFFFFFFFSMSVQKVMCIKKKEEAKTGTGMSLG